MKVRGNLLLVDDVLILLEGLDLHSHQLHDRHEHRGGLFLLQISHKFDNIHGQYSIERQLLSVNISTGAGELSSSSPPSSSGFSFSTLGSFAKSDIFCYNNCSAHMYKSIESTRTAQKSRVTLG